MGRFIGRGLLLAGALGVAFSCSTPKRDFGSAGTGGVDAGGGIPDASSGAAAGTHAGSAGTASSIGGLPEGGTAGTNPEGGMAGTNPDDAAPIGCSDGAVRRCGDDTEHGVLGNCANGQESCEGGVWGPCSVAPAAADTCKEGDDANCNGTVNDGCPCTDGNKQACGPVVDIGECRRGTQTCTGSQWGACVGALLAKPRDCTSGLDLDCDGLPDNKVDGVCQCTVGASQDCGTHPANDGKGPCHAGSQTCVASADKTTSSFNTCVGSVGPAAKDACDDKDANCNGIANEGCSCVNGATQACGPPAALGICKRGTQTCANAAWGTCVGATYATSRDCTSALDNDCNGTIDNAESSCACTPGTSQACTTSQLGPCKPGNQSCVLASDKKSSAWATCAGAAPASKDTCDPNNDANCNGIPNEGCACVNGATKICGSNVGLCKQGTQTCTNSAWGSCVGEVKAKSRDCTQSTDNDCNGTVDNQETPCKTCPLGTSAACSTGLKGPCANGTKTCVASADKQSVAWGSCVAPTPAAKDNCSPKDDANCDGTTGGGCCATRTCGTTCCSSTTAPANAHTGCSASTCTTPCDYPISCSTSDGQYCGSWNFDDVDLSGWGFTNSLGGFVTAQNKQYEEHFTDATGGDVEIFVKQFMCPSGQTANLNGKALHFEISAIASLASTVYVTPVLLDANYNVLYTFSTQGFISDFPNGLTTGNANNAADVTAIGLQLQFTEDVASGVISYDNIRIQ